LALPRRRLYVVAQLVAAALLLYFVGRTLAEQWDVLTAQRLDADLDVSSIALSGALTFGAYALLIQVWRMLITSAGGSLSFWKAARIWSISGLWRYVPGKVWSIGAMSALAHRENVPAVAAAGTAVLNTVLSIACGIAISMLLAWRWLSALNPGAQPAAILLLVLAVVGLFALPAMVPRLAALAARLAGRDVQLRAPPPWALGLAVAGNVLAWALYGLAFMWLVDGVLGDTVGAPWQYVAVFTASYVVGYLFLLVPGGIGPREAMMIGLMTSLKLATAKEAALVAVVSRVWLTFLEVVPGLVLLALQGASRPPSTEPPPDVSRQ
jgi:uncharacterized membrane protein YbhN (UPF0104 family)